MMNSNLLSFSTILFLFISYSNARDLFDSIDDDYFESDSPNSSSSIFPNFLTNSTESSSTTLSSSQQLSVPVENGSMDLIIGQLNEYRHTHIYARIEKCDSNIRLNDLCEFYSFNYSNNSLVRRTIDHFERLDNIFDELINRTTMDDFNQSCVSVNTCRDNLPNNDIQSTVNWILKYGNTFCSLEQCHSRLEALLDSCPALTNTGINCITLSLLPMLCSLYNRQSVWSPSKCQNELVHLFYVFYAFGTQIQTCYENGSSSSDICSTECQITSYVLNNLIYECYDQASFLTDIPILSQYSLINIEELCDEKNNSTKPRLIHFLEKYFHRRRLWYQFYNQPIYIISISVFTSLFILWLCLYCCVKLKSRSKSKNRRFDNDYEYTRLNNGQSLELANSSQISNGDSMANEIIESESEINSTDRSHSSEYQRLLFVNS